MNFLVLVLILLLEKLCRWRMHLQRDELLRRVLARLESAPRLQGQAALQLLLVLGVPLLLVGLLLWSLAPLAYGWLLLPLHVALLLWSLGRGDPQHSLAPFRARWQRGDTQAAYLEAERDLGLQAEDAPGLLRQVQGFLLWQAYEGFFAVIFWYALGGPLPALAYRLLALLGEHAEGEELRGYAVRLRHMLDWLPARLLALSLALAGNFVSANRVLWPRLLDFPASAAQLVADAGRAASDTPGEGGGLETLDELWSLLQRAGLIWYSALALGILLL
ncbi:regulatory signaling modulator protein AmpE [Pseudomonas oryzae]|uniref:AmpE protein n=1 Tax=Pseudomonas oryzae TaxID=1392877 RepID=A0A1H1VA95_9PSED|nr:regulatory signaling modulator protein AmpE [Pseudomonas oryzae]SDS81583.1 AmpE protein [Pseudomonas oryzae]